MSNSGLPYPVRCSGDSCGQLEVGGVPLGCFSGSTYEELSLELKKDDVFVFCTDGVFETVDPQGRDFGAAGLLDVIARLRHLPAAEIVDGIFEAVQTFRGDALPADDMTAVVLKVTR